MKKSYRIQSRLFSISKKSCVIQSRFFVI